MSDYGLSELRPEYRCFSCPWGDGTAILFLAPRLRDVSALLDLLNRLNNDPRVAYAQPNYIYHFLTEPQNSKPQSVVCSGGRIARESRSQIAFLQEVTTGDIGVKVVVDTGLPMRHPIVQDNKGKIKQDMVVRDALQGATGAHVLMTLSQDFGWNSTRGVAPDITIQHISVQTDEEGRQTNTWVIIQALDAVIRFYGAGHRINVVSLTLGTFSDSDDIIGQLVKIILTGTRVGVIRNLLGIPIVAAAGNDPSRKVYPAALDGVYSVTAVDSDGQIYYKAYRGPSVDFADLGACVEVPRTVRGEAAEGYSSTYAGGTSIAAARFSAALTLLTSKYGPLHPTIVEMYLQKSAKDLGAPGWDPVYGHGLIMPRDALDLLEKSLTASYPRR